MADLPSVALVAAMLQFASSASGLPIPPDMPLPVPHFTRSVAGVTLGLAGTPEAVTTEDGQVWLRPEWSGTAHDVCVLGHELVHVLQFRNRVPRSGDSYEPAAYHVSDLCFRAYGI